MKLKLGVLGLGSIFHRVMTDLPNFRLVELYAVAARDGARAKAACEKYGAKKWYGSYEELLADPAVDLVYIATPHPFHKQHTLMSLKAGKHVICEKPFAMNDTEAVEMIRCAKENDRFLMEAMWTRFLPAIRKLKELADSGELGEIRHIHADFSYLSEPDAESRIFNPRLGGGSLLDVGIYPLSIIAFLLGTDMTFKSSAVRAFTGVDARFNAILQYKNGATAGFMSGIDVNGLSRMTVYGTKAAVTIPDFWHAVRLEILRNGQTEVLTFPPENEGHHHQFDHAARSIAAGQLENELMPHAETVRLMKIMTEMLRENEIFYPEAASTHQ